MHRLADAPPLPGERAHFDVNGRFVTVFNDRGVLRAMDSVCYHTGGPLTLGDIEDVDGDPCVKCPWHGYLVSLVDGGKFYEGLVLDAATKKLVPTGWQKKPHAQRVHTAVLNGDGSLGVLLNLDGQADSDRYACVKECGTSVLANNIVSPHSRYERSGHVLKK